MEGLHWSARYCSPECKGPRKRKPPRAERDARTVALNALRSDPPPCENCQNPIPPERIPAKYCSDGCNHQAYARRNAERLEEERLTANEARATARRVMMECDFCGKPFERRAWNQRYCSKLCSQRGWRRDNPEWYDAIAAHSEARRHARWVARRDARPACPLCGSPIPADRGPKAIYCSSVCTDKAYRRRHPRRLKKRNRIRWARNSKHWRPIMRAYMAARMANEPGFREAQRHKSKLRYRTHRQAIREQQRLITLSNPGRGSIYAAAYRARKAGAETFRYTEADWQWVMVHYNYCCAYCGVNPGRDKHGRPLLQKEHVIPLIRGGRHSAGNILPACSACNNAKLGKTVMEWRMAEIRYRRFLEERGVAS